MGIPQTSYDVDPARGVVGRKSRTQPGEVVQTRRANGVVRPGQYVVFAGDTCLHPSSAPTPQTKGGIALRRAYGDANYADKELVEVLTEGFVWIDPENTVTVDNPAYARFSVATTEEKGAFRSDPGTLGLTFTINTATNSSRYSIELDGILFTYDSDGTATTAEVATGLASAIDAHASYVATNPTSTTILVVKVTTSTLLVEVTGCDSRITYADGSVAAKIPGSYYRTTSGTLVELEVHAV